MSQAIKPLATNDDITGSLHCLFKKEDRPRRKPSGAVWWWNRQCPLPEHLHEIEQIGRRVDPRIGNV
jgi:hypothetical protein